MLMTLSALPLDGDVIVAIAPDTLCDISTDHDTQTQPSFIWDRNVTKGTIATIISTCCLPMHTCSWSYVMLLMPSGMLMYNTLYATIDCWMMIDRDVQLLLA